VTEDRQLDFQEVVGGTFETSAPSPPIKISGYEGEFRRAKKGDLPYDPARVPDFCPPPPGPLWEKYFKSISPKKPFAKLASLTGTSQSEEYQKSIGRPWRELPKDHPFVRQCREILGGKNKKEKLERARKYAP
jgi:hypothetical protein